MLIRRYEGARPPWISHRKCTTEFNGQHNPITTMSHACVCCIVCSRRNKPYTAVNDPLLLFPFSRRTVVQSASCLLAFNWLQMTVWLTLLPMRPSRSNDGNVSKNRSSIRPYVAYVSVCFGKLLCHRHIPVCIYEFGTRQRSIDLCREEKAQELIVSLTYNNLISFHENFKNCNNTKSSIR